MRPAREGPIEVGESRVAAPESLLDPTRRIYANRNLRFDQIHHVGFDMDYTLARYMKRNMETLSFKLTAKRLVERLGYPEQILHIPYDWNFVVRGLVVDKRLGNIFKMDGHRHVGRVYHGRRELSKDDRRHHYRGTKIRVSASRYHWLDTLFALPEAALYADIIDLYEGPLEQKRVAYNKIFEDIRASIDACHRDGSLKSIVQGSIDNYVEIDPLLPQALHKMRSAGKRLFVLTNSYWEYTNIVMGHLLSAKLPEYPHWRNFFDIVIVGSQKPGFFTADAPFVAIDPKSGAELPHKVTKLEPRAVYQGGSIGALERLIGGGGEHVLYVGDHIYGDIIRSKKDSLWRTALVLEELETELVLARKMQRTQLDLLGLEERHEHLEDEIANLRLKNSGASSKRNVRSTLDRRRQELRAVIARRDALSHELDAAYNPYWGSVFREGKEISRFGEQVEDYACVYTSRVSNFVNYSPNQYFRAPRHWMPHDKI